MHPPLPLSSSSSSSSYALGAEGGGGAGPDSLPYSVSPAAAEERAKYLRVQAAAAAAGDPPSSSCAECRYVWNLLSVGVVPEGTLGYALGLPGGAENGGRWGGGLGALAVAVLLLLLVRQLLLPLHMLLSFFHAILNQSQSVHGKSYSL